MIRRARRFDINAIAIIENASFADDCYTREQLLYEFKENPFAKILVAVVDEEVVGFIIYMITFNSATILQVATRPINRRHGIATKLIKAMIDDVMSLGYGVVENITLEVRKSNEVAHNFYLKNNFKDVTIKPKYYNNGEDAIYMMRVML